eukprot:TRINITY_DN9852_c0_g1_i7.p1 TRINITY_DN9852_c0_g1~~TRINITY_DN9852_c0_g1_i7.p1  ORF type:complete len:105 (+),score=33.59 TRINITY_DN9852_c0_g1_i7:215-529(+)
MSQRSTRRALEADLTRVNAGYKLRDVYAAFAGFGEGQAVAVTDKDRFENSTRVISGTNHQLDSRKFMKLCKDCGCLLYTSDAADEEDSVDLGGRRIIKKKKKEN